MIHQLAAHFPNHRLQKLPITKNIPFIGTVEIPVWCAHQLAFITPKGNKKTVLQMLKKLVKKVNKIK